MEWFGLEGMFIASQSGLVPLSAMSRNTHNSIRLSEHPVQFLTTLREQTSLPTSNDLSVVQHPSAHPHPSPPVPAVPSGLSGLRAVLTGALRSAERHLRKGAAMGGEEHRGLRAGRAHRVSAEGRGGEHGGGRRGCRTPQRSDAPRPAASIS